MPIPDKIAKLIIMEHAAALRQGYTGRPTYGPLNLSDGARERIKTAIMRDMREYDRYHELTAGNEESLLLQAESEIPEDDWDFMMEFETMAKSHLHRAEGKMAAWVATTIELEYDNSAWGVGYKSVLES